MTKSRGVGRGSPKPITYVVNENGCHICTSHKPDKDGYVIFRRNNKRMKIHRYVYEKHKGNIPEGMIIMHICDTPPCINPKHLILGNKTLNMLDKTIKGRQSKGETAGHSNLIKSDVQHIRQMRGKVTQQVLADKFGISQVAVSSIQLYKNWKHN